MKSLINHVYESPDDLLAGVAAFIESLFVELAVSEGNLEIELCPRVRINVQFSKILPCLHGPFLAP